MNIHIYDIIILNLIVEFNYFTFCLSFEIVRLDKGHLESKLTKNFKG